MKRTFKIENDSCLKTIKNFEIDKSLFVKQFRETFDWIYCYHATRLNLQEIKEIKDHGLIKTNKELLQSKALFRFISQKDSLELRNSISTHILNYYSENENKISQEINLGLCRKILTDDAYQYLYYGPESLVPLADSLTKKIKGIYFRDRLRNFGSPYLIKLIVPVDKVGYTWIENFWNYADANSKFMQEENNDISIVLQENIKANQILEIEEYKERIINKYGMY